MRYSLVRRARPVLPHPPLALWALHRTVPAVSTELGQVRHGSHRAREDITTSISSSQSPDDLLELWATHSDHMRNDIHLGNLWNKMGRFRKVIHNNRSFLSSRQRELKELLVETGAACSSQSFDARGLANIMHGAVKAGLLTYELGRDVHALCDEVGEALAPVIESQFHPQMAANSCWAFGAARHPHLRLFGAVSAALCASPFRTESLGSQGLANVAWAYAKVGHADAALFGALGAAAERSLPELCLSPQQLSNTLWAFAALGHPAPALFDAVAVAATAAPGGEQLLESLSPQARDTPATTCGRSLQCVGPQPLSSTSGRSLRGLGRGRAQAVAGLRHGHQQPLHVLRPHPQRLCSLRRRWPM